MLNPGDIVVNVDVDDDVTIGPFDDNDDIYLRHGSTGKHQINEAQIITEAVTLTVPVGTGYRSVRLSPEVDTPTSTVSDLRPDYGRPDTGMLYIPMPHRKSDDRLCVTVNVFADSRSGGLWEDELAETTYDYLKSANDLTGHEGQVEILDGTWGKVIAGSVIATRQSRDEIRPGDDIDISQLFIEDTVIMAAEGPRWVLRMNAHGEGLIQADIDMLWELMSLAVVHRGVATGEGVIPMVAGSAMSMKLVESKVFRGRFHEAS